MKLGWKWFIMEYYILQYNWAIDLLFIVTIRIDHTCYRFTGFIDFSRILQTFRVGFYADELMHSATYCLSCRLVVLMPIYICIN